MEFFRGTPRTERESWQCSLTTAHQNGLLTSPENKERLERSFRKWAETKPCSLSEKDYWYARARCPVRNIYNDASGASLICEDETGKFEAWTASRL